MKELLTKIIKKFLKVKHYLPCTLDHKCHFQQLQLIQIFQPDPKMVSPMRRWRLKFIAQCTHLSYILRGIFFDLLLLLFFNGTDMYLSAFCINKALLYQDNSRNALESLFVEEKAFYFTFISILLAVKVGNRCCSCTNAKKIVSKSKFVIKCVKANVIHHQFISFSVIFYRVLNIFMIRKYNNISLYTFLYRRSHKRSRHILVSLKGFT